LKVLDLSNNSISDEGARYLADALMHNTGLIELNVTNNDFTELGARALAEANRSNPRCRLLRPGESNSNEMFQNVCAPS
jgi:Ran GTPase-activating protein (RanGAP) involved in mRNA processing and transport